MKSRSRDVNKHAGGVNELFLLHPWTNMKIILFDLINMQMILIWKLYLIDLID